MKTTHTEICIQRNAVTAYGYSILPSGMAARPGTGWEPMRIRGSNAQVAPRILRNGAHCAVGFVEHCGSPSIRFCLRATNNLFLAFLLYYYFIWIAIVASSQWYTSCPLPICLILFENNLNLPVVEEMLFLSALRLLPFIGCPRLKTSLYFLFLCLAYFESGELVSCSSTISW